MAHRDLARQVGGSTTPSGRSGQTPPNARCRQQEASQCLQRPLSSVCYSLLLFNQLRRLSGGEAASATCPAPRPGTNSTAERAPVAGMRVIRAERRSPSRSFTRRWRRGTTSFASRPQEAGVGDRRHRQRPRRGPCAKPLRYKSFRYQADSWSKPSRSSPKWSITPGEFARPGFLVRPCRVVRWCTTTIARPSSGSKKVSKRRTGRGCTFHRRNEVRLQLSVLAYISIWRRLAAAASRTGR